MSGLSRVVPRTLKELVKRSWPSRFTAYCPVCETYQEAFATAGTTPRPNALCPNCLNLERHRFLWLFLNRQTEFRKQPLKLLHFAPEADFGRRLSHAEHVTYISVDLESYRRPSVCMDITRLGLRDGQLDAIVCSHVLEHIPDDLAAMRECHRVLRSGGWLAVQVPIHALPTDEDFSVTDPAARRTRFGQEDHVRQYGMDIVDRLGGAGFEVTTITPSELLTAADSRSFIANEPPIFFCRKK